MFTFKWQPKTVSYKILLDITSNMLPVKLHKLLKFYKLYFTIAFTHQMLLVNIQSKFFIGCQVAAKKQYLTRYFWVLQVNFTSNFLQLYVRLKFDLSKKRFALDVYVKWQPKNSILQDTAGHYKYILQVKLHTLVKSYK